MGTTRPFAHVRCSELFRGFDLYVAFVQKDILIWYFTQMQFGSTRRNVAIVIAVTHSVVWATKEFIEGFDTLGEPRIDDRWC